MDTIFPRGNLDIWNYYIQTKLPEGMDVIIRVIVPTLETALQELVGETGSFKREVGQIDFLENKDGTPRGIVGKLEYDVPSFKVPNVPQEAIGQDEAFINSYITRIEAKFKPTTINTETGKVVVEFSFEIGGMK
jgi:hypothetical protein